jgi:hypothetical protein
MKFFNNAGSQDADKLLTIRSTCTPCTVHFFKLAAIVEGERWNWDDRIDSIREEHPSAGLTCRPASCGLVRSDNS